MPTLGTYNYALIQRMLHTRIHGRLSDLNSRDTNTERDLINNAVRTALSEIDFRGNIRETLLTPNLMDNQYDYALPNDVKADKIIDLRPQVTDSRGKFETYDLVAPSEFDRRKKSEKGLFTILNDDLNRVLRVTADVEDNTLVIGQMESITGEGDCWEGFGNTADSNVKTDLVDFIQGNGAVRFSDTVLGAGDSIIGIENNGFTAFDISAFLSKGSFFVYGKLDTGDTGIKQLNLRLGSDSNNYRTFSDSTGNDCNPFVSGWNLVRLDASTSVSTGAPVDTAITYAALFWGRDSGKHLDTDFAFDYLIAKTGKYYNLSYYSRYVWQDTAFGVSENSSNDSHTLLLQNDEVEVVMAKAAEYASQFLRDNTDVVYWQKEFERLKQIYLMSHPSQASVLTQSYYDLESIEGTNVRETDS